MTQSRRPRISVIIPALNEAEMIARAVGSAWESGSDEVLVADGGSSDETLALAQAHGAVVIAAAPGRAIQQNAAAAIASGDLLVFLHADAALAPGSLEPLRKKYAAAAADSTSPVVCFGGFRQRIEAPATIYRFLEWGNCQRAGRLGLVYGDQAIFIDRQTFRTVGGFPETPLMEDYLLSQQVRRVVWPEILPGPVLTSARRWQRYGVVRQTFRNWCIIARFRLGVPAERLAESYRRHDQV